MSDSKSSQKNNAKKTRVEAITKGSRAQDREIISPFPVRVQKSRRCQKKETQSFRASRSGGKSKTLGGRKPHRELGIRGSQKRHTSDGKIPRHPLLSKIRRIWSGG